MAFRDLVRKQRQSGSGILSSVGSAAGASMRESVDIRNILFTRDSLLGALFPNVKGFKADGKTTKSKTSPSSLMSMGGASSGLSDAKLDIIAQNTKIAAKNSMVMPSMARDMNVMRQNIIKMVNLSGGKPSTRADAFFLKASEREKAYESQMQETKTTTPTKVDSSTEAAGGDKKSFIGKFLSGLLAVLGAAIFLYFTNDKFKDVIDNVVTNIVDSVTNVLDSASKVGLGIGAAGVAGLAAKSAIQRRMPGSGGRRGRGGPGRTSVPAGTPGQARPRDKWGRFVKYVQVNNKPLYKKIGGRLVTMAVMATLPILGWVSTALTFIGSLSLAWELFRMWQQWNKETEGEDIGEDTETPDPRSEEEIQLLESAALPESLPADSKRGLTFGVGTGDARLKADSPTPAIPAVGMEAGRGTNRSPTPDTTKNLLDIIAKGESGAAGYNAMNQGGNTQTGILGSGHSESVIGKKLTEMTVGEILERGKLPLKNENRIFAAGRYQIIPETLRGLVDQGFANLDDKFDESTQDKLGSALIEQSGALRLAEQGNLIEAQNRLSKIWAAIPSATTGQTALGGPNKADPRLGNLVQTTLRASGTEIASASSTVDSGRMQAMAPASTVPASTAAATPRTSSTQAQQVSIPNTIDSDLFDALIARATEFS
jgi:hypothetical protein